jgi:hypothetical protein
VLRKNLPVEFQPEAQRYCALIERAASYEREQLVEELAESLAALLVAAAQLPAVTPTGADLPDRPSHEQWGERFADVQKALGDWDVYWTTLDTYGEEAESAVSLALADGLADIWRDLKEGLLALEAAAAPQDVVWEWRFGFYTHWGRHATEALRALHARLADQGGPFERR